MQVSSATGAQAPDMARQMRERSFSRADRDGDGGLSLVEFAAVGPTAAGAGAADPAKVKETASLSAAVFNRVDANGDGIVTPAELEAGTPDLPPPPISPATMSALLSGQEASGSREGGPLAGLTDGSTVAEPGRTSTRLAEALDKYLQFSAGRPSADPSAGG